MAFQYRVVSGRGLLSDIEEALNAAGSQGFEFAGVANGDMAAGDVIILTRRTDDPGA